jgi:DNA invertase Pin-like site-specific DNA recombinase
MRVAIYARVSTDDKGQDPENQLRQLREYCENAKHRIVAEYVDHASGRKDTNGRKQFAALFADASKRKFDMVLFWALDRFSREGMRPTVAHLERLNSYGVAFHSYTEPLLNTDNEMVRDILLAVMSALAKQEAIRLSDRTKAGMARAKAAGKHVGRPSLNIGDHIAKLIAGGASVYRAAKECGIDHKTAAKYAALSRDALSRE